MKTTAEQLDDLAKTKAEIAHLKLRYPQQVEPLKVAEDFLDSFERIYKLEAYSKDDLEEINKGLEAMCADNWD